MQKNYTSTVRCGFRDRETFEGENTALNKVLFLICLSLQETLQALCCEVSASCLPLFLTHSFSSPFLSPFFPPPAVWVIEFIPCGRRTTSGPRHTSCCQLGSHATNSDSCESQCCSLIQGKCQTQETVFKYLYIQKFFSCNNFYSHRATCEHLFSTTTTNPGTVQLNADVFANFACTLLCAADVSSVLMTTGAHCWKIADVWYCKHVWCLHSHARSLCMTRHD